MKKISLLIPSAYPDKLSRLMRTAMSNVDRPSSIEFVVNLKSNDDYRLILVDGKPVAEHKTEHERLMSSLWEQALNHATGDWILFGADDIVVETNGWDTFFQNAIQRYEDEIALIWPNDDMFEDNLSIFPMISRKVIGIIGDIFPMPFKKYKADDTFFDIIPKERHCYLPNVMFRHDHYVESGPGFRTRKGKLYPNDTKLLKSDGELFSQ
jgi:hypothetical protein